MIGDAMLVKIYSTNTFTGQRRLIIWPDIPLLDNIQQVMARCHRANHTLACLSCGDTLGDFLGGNTPLQTTGHH